MNLADLPVDPALRLAYYQQARASERALDALEEERARVAEAMSKAPADRTGADWCAIAYSAAFGTAASCGCGGR